MYVIAKQLFCWHICKQYALSHPCMHRACVCVCVCVLEATSCVHLTYCLQCTSSSIHNHYDALHNGDTNVFVAWEHGKQLHSETVGLLGIRWHAEQHAEQRTWQR